MDYPLFFTGGNTFKFKNLNTKCQNTNDFKKQIWSNDHGNKITLEIRILRKHYFF